MVTIRPYAREDIPLHFAAVSESKTELGSWMPWCHPGYALEDSRKWIDSQLIAFSEGAEYGFAIVDGENRFLGGCGLNHLERSDLRANLGYWVRSSARGRGVATTAATLLAEWAFSTTPFCRLEVIAALGNRASQRVAEKIGAQREGVLRSRLQLHGQPHDAVIYSLIRPSSSHLSSFAGSPRPVS